MGHTGVEVSQFFDDDDTEVEYVSYTMAFEKACPLFISYGLTYDEFWYDDPYKALYQLKAYKCKIKHEDELLWEQGMYIYEAILQCAPILHPFSKAKKPLQYTEKPHLQQLEEEKTEQEKQQEIENERLKAQIWVNNWARSMQKYFENKDK